MTAAPAPSALSTRIRPWCASTMLCDTESPSPTWPARSFVVKNGSKIRSRIAGGIPEDSWDRWNEQRDRYFNRTQGYRYADRSIYGIDDLDDYGAWDETGDYGYVWYPRVAVGWEPYRVGRWIWRDPWGWTWLSDESWGWAPYHYGRWAVIRGRWGWVPVGPGGAYPSYSPALVGFVGGGSGVSFSVSIGGFVGWFPLAPREPFDPWWQSSRSTVNVTGFNYAYRSRATVVARNAFVGSEPVDRSVVRDARVVREVAAAPVIRGPIPVLPTRDSIRVSPVSVQGRASIAPPARIVQRGPFRYQSQMTSSCGIWPKRWK